MNSGLEWLARNSVAANLLMLGIVLAGLMTIPRAMVEVFPETSADRISITVPYPGASPEEVEQSICVRIEEAIWDVDGIQEILSTASEGAGSVMVEVRTDASPREVLDDIKVRIDAIDTFPQEAEQPIVKEVVLRSPVIDVAIHGPADERSLKALAEQVRDELLSRPGITQAEVVNTRPYEIAIELSEEALRRYGLTFEEVATAVRRGSLDLPAGALRTRAGEILLRTAGQAYRGEEFASLVLRSEPDGTVLRVGDVAQVIDGFAETDQTSRFDGQPSAQVRVYRVGRQNALDVAAAVRDYVEEARPRMPEGIELTTWRDESIILAGRLELMIRNGLGGLALVTLVLALFLRFHLAFWVAIGISIAFLGGFAVTHQLGGSINMISLFALILVLGIVVDDAIVVAESVHDAQERGQPGVEGAVAGTRDVARPVVFAVLTTIAAFLPMAFLEGFTGRIWAIIPMVVVPTLVFSLVESLGILPAHLAHRSSLSARLAGWPPFCWWVRFQGFFGNGLVRFGRSVYAPFLRTCLAWRYTTLATSLAVLLITAGIVAGGHLRFVYFPVVEADNVVAHLELPLGTPVERTAEIVQDIERGIEELRAHIDRLDPPDERGSKLRHYFVALGSQPFRSDMQRNAVGIADSFVGGHLAEINLALAPSEERTISSPWVAQRWRELIGEVPGAVLFEIGSDLISAGKPVHVRLYAQRIDVLLDAAERLEAHLGTLPGVYEIASSWREGKQELHLELLPEGVAAGLTLADLATQTRHAFYGAEAQRIQRGRGELKVMVRYPEADRRSLDALDGLFVRTPAGEELPFRHVATARLERGYASLSRGNRMRTIDLTAEFDPVRGAAAGLTATQVRESLDGEWLPALAAEHPGLNWSFEGAQQEQMRTLGDLAYLYAFALFAIFALIAIPFRSYVQPLIVMLAIPFGCVGAVIGHLIMGYELSIISVLGLVALGGVVVNGSLVLVDYVNRHRDDGLPVLEATVEAGLARFRPILLTSMTTFAGLTPLMMERSVQAKFLIPMAVSLAYGVLFATVITLVLVPVVYVILEDLRRGWLWLYGTRDRAPEPVARA